MNVNIFLIIVTLVLTTNAHIPTNSSLAIRDPRCKTQIEKTYDKKQFNF